MITTPDPDAPSTSTVHQAYRFALDVTPRQAEALRSHAGAARFAYNHMLAELKTTLETRKWERALLGGCLTPAQGWSLAALRRTWNRHKHDVAPWWQANSKEAYNTGLQWLADGLKNWADSKSGKRAGPTMGFPRFKGRNARRSVRFTTGVIRVESDRHHVTLPRIGTLKTHESTRKLARRAENGTARILSATVTKQAGRWYVSFTCEVQRAIGRPAHKTRRARAAGVDVGIKHLAVVAYDDGTHQVVDNPRALQSAQRRLGRLQRKAARQTRGSKRRAQTLRKIGRLHARVANVRRDALHKLTSELAQTVDVIGVETLAAKNMMAAGGARKRGLNRHLADASFGQLRRMLEYKTSWYGAELVDADRFYPSSKTCSGCGTVRAKLSLTERDLHCSDCGIQIDRDLNAARNLMMLAQSRWESQNGRREPGTGPTGHVEVAADDVGGGQGRAATSTKQPPPSLVAA